MDDEQLPLNFDVSLGYSLVETVGIDFGDYVTAVDVEQFERLAKEWVYLPVLAAIALVFLPQSRRRQRMQENL